MGCDDKCTIVLKKCYKVVDNTPIVIPKGQMIWKIVIRSLIAETITIGTTVGGDEIMMSTQLTPGIWLSVTMDIMPVGDGSVIIYFTGITAYTEITIYKLKLP